MTIAYRASRNNREQNKAHLLVSNIPKQPCLLAANPFLSNDENLSPRRRICLMRYCLEQQPQYVLRHTWDLMLPMLVHGGLDEQREP